jgi:hypothetical protein
MTSICLQVMTIVTKSDPASSSDAGRRKNHSNHLNSTLHRKSHLPRVAVGDSAALVVHQLSK